MRWLKQRSSEKKVFCQQYPYSPFAKLDVNDEEDDTQQETNAAHCDVGNTQKVIFASKEACGGKDHALAATKWVNRVAVLHFQIIFAFREAILEACHAVVNLPIQLTEGWKSSTTHPHDQIFILVAIVFRVVTQLPHILGPVWRLECVLESYWKKGINSAKT